jgi:hypothetical protein
VNLFRLFKDLIPDPPLQVGEVTSISGGTALITTPDGYTLIARGSATVGQNVFVRNGLIESVAPSLSVEVISV